MKSEPDKLPRRTQGTGTVVSIDAIRIGDSPRLSGEDPEHVRALAETSSALPPILVHRDTMRLIDGMHRLLAARLNNQDKIEIQFFDGDDGDAFVAAVRANIAHGLPLSLADREAAAARIVKSHPQWSDRAIAEVVGLADPTVAKIRNCSAEQIPQPDARIGRDGRLRPLSSAAGRRLASQIIAERPDASLREIAKESGISPATARDVRERVRRGDDPVPFKEARAERENAHVRRNSGLHKRSPAKRMRVRGLTLKKLQRDPSLRMNENGRRLLRWLAAHSIHADTLKDLRAKIPAHCATLVADLALEYAEEWRIFAEMLDTTERGRE
jgi:ParB-like chromosome segregation protein Spo0J